MATFGKNNGLAEFAFHTALLDDQPGTCATASAIKYCDSDNTCSTQCAGDEVCYSPQPVCSNAHGQTCQLAANDCAPPGQCQSLSLCSNNPALTCVQGHDCCPTYLCTDPNAANNDKAAYLLKAMSAAGTGNFLRFVLGDYITFGSLSFTTTISAFVKKVFLVSNYNSKFQNGDDQPDSDGDGLTDRQEVCYHEILTGQCTNIYNCDCTLDVWTPDHPTGTDTDPANADTDGDGINDLIEMLYASLNLDPLRFDLPEVCADLERPYPDSDGDGLNDCEERIIGTDPTLFDTDRDGYPDGIEVKTAPTPS